MNFENLISLVVQGNLDNEAVPKVESAVAAAFERLTATLASRGYIRTANQMY